MDMNRRGFLKRLGIGAAAVAPLIPLEALASLDRDDSTVLTDAPKPKYQVRVGGQDDYGNTHWGDWHDVDDAGTARVSRPRSTRRFLIQTRAVDQEGGRAWITTQRQRFTASSAAEKQLPTVTVPIRVSWTD